MTDTITSAEIASETKCRHCDFTYRQHGRYSEICPIFIKGMLHQFQAVEEEVAK